MAASAALPLALGHPARNVAVRNLTHTNQTKIINVRIHIYIYDISYLSKKYRNVHTLMYIYIYVYRYMYTWVHIHMYIYSQTSAYPKTKQHVLRIVLPGHRGAVLGIHLMQQVC